MATFTASCPVKPSAISKISFGLDIFFINSEDIKKSLQEIDFLSEINVRKKYPNTILVTIYETTPIGILFKNKKKYILMQFDAW